MNMKRWRYLVSNPYDGGFVVWVFSFSLSFLTLLILWLLDMFSLIIVLKTKSLFFTVIFNLSNQTFWISFIVMIINVVIIRHCYSDSSNDCHLLISWLANIYFSHVPLLFVWTTQQYCNYDDVKCFCNAISVAIFTKFWRNK